MKLGEIEAMDPREYRIVRWTYSRAHGGGEGQQRVHVDRVDAYIARLEKMGYANIRVEAWKEE